MRETDHNREVDNDRKILNQGIIKVVEEIDNDDIHVIENNVKNSYGADGLLIPRVNIKDKFDRLNVAQYQKFTDLAPGLRSDVATITRYFFEDFNQLC